MSEHQSCSSGSDGLPFQKRVVEWLMACFSMEVCRDGIERNHRFLEEALELVQALNCTRSEAHQLVDYVFDRPVGEPFQELGGSLVTLTALANCHDMDLEEAGETELARVWTKIDKIRAKQAAKPKHSPLPQHVDLAQASGNPEDWREDPSADERWNLGLDFGMNLLCDYLGVDKNEVTWDAATETVEGDVSAVLGNILRAKFGEDWSLAVTPSPGEPK